MPNQADLAGAEFLSASGDTLYTVVNEGSTFVRCIIRCREMNWKITNPCARFSKSHVSEMVNSGNWIEV